MKYLTHPLKEITQISFAWATAPEIGQWQPKDDPLVCEFCKKGPLIKRVEAIKFRQWSRKGYVHCSAMIPVSVCVFWGVRSFELGTDRILDEAFQRESDKAAQ